MATLAPIALDQVCLLASCFSIGKKASQIRAEYEAWWKQIGQDLLLSNPLDGCDEDDLPENEDCNEEANGALAPEQQEEKNLLNSLTSVADIIPAEKEIEKLQAQEASSSTGDCQSVILLKLMRRKGRGGQLVRFKTHRHSSLHTSGCSPERRVEWFSALGRLDSAEVGQTVPQLLRIRPSPRRCFEQSNGPRPQAPRSTICESIPWHWPARPSNVPHCAAPIAADNVEGL